MDDQNIYPIQNAHIAVYDPETGTYGESKPIPATSVIMEKSELSEMVDNAVDIPIVTHASTVITLEMEGNKLAKHLLDVAKRYPPRYKVVIPNVASLGGVWRKNIFYVRTIELVDGRVYWYDGKHWALKDIIRRRFRVALRKKRNRG